MPTTALPVRRHALVGLQPGGQLLGQEGLPLVGVVLAVALRRLVPVGVEAGLAADRHDRRQAGAVVPLERRGVDVPAVVVVLRAQAVEQVDRVRSAALELDPDVAAHRRREHIRYSTGRPGRENAPAVADPPAKPISPGSAAAATALTASRRNHLPRNFSMNFITATNPPFHYMPQSNCRCFACVSETRATCVDTRTNTALAISRLANDCDSARTRNADSAL